MAINLAAILTNALQEIINQGVPVASPEGAVEGANNHDRMTPLRTKESINANAATKDQGAKADSAVQPEDLHAVAISGNYNDLSGKPTFGSAAAQDVSAFASSAQLEALAEGLSDVAISGQYSDLAGKPTFGSAAALDASALATAAQGAKADTALQADTQLTPDASYPLAPLTFWIKSPVIELHRFMYGKSYGNGTDVFNAFRSAQAKLVADGAHKIRLEAAEHVVAKGAESHLLQFDGPAFNGMEILGRGDSNTIIRPQASDANTFNCFVFGGGSYGVFRADVAEMQIQSFFRGTYYSLGAAACEQSSIHYKLNIFDSDIKGDYGSTFRDVVQTRYENIVSEDTDAVCLQAEFCGDIVIRGWETQASRTKGCKTAVGFQFGTAVNSVLASEYNMRGLRKGMIIRNLNAGSVAYPSQYNPIPHNMKFGIGYFDANCEIAVDLESVFDIDFGDVWMCGTSGYDHNGAWISGGGLGLRVGSASRGVRVVQGQVTNNATSGISLTSSNPRSHVSISKVFMRANARKNAAGQDITSDNTVAPVYSHINVGSGVGCLQIEGINAVGDHETSIGGGGPSSWATAKYGIDIAAGTANNLRVKENDLSLNRSGGINNLSTGSNQVISNNFG